MMQVAHVKLTAEHPDLSLTELPGLSLYAAFIEAEERHRAGQRVTLQVTYTFGEPPKVDS